MAARSASQQVTREQTAPAAADSASEKLPRWALAALCLILVVAGTLFAWQVGRREYPAFYSMAVRSMATSWRAFFFGAVDPAGATITIDKLPGFLWPQALCVRAFGFHAWCLSAPQVVEGLVTVVTLFRLVRRWRGPTAGLLAAGMFALTPVVVSVFGLPMEDAAVVMCATLAVSAAQRAIHTGQLGPLAMAGVWIGLGFQAKMAQAWLVAPACAIGYLVAAPIRAGVRWLRMSIAAVVALAVSLSWVAVAALVPAASRPYLDGTTNNNPLSMAFAYNGVARFDALRGHAAALGSVPTQPGGGFLGAVGSAGGIGTGWGKLFGPLLASQVGWMYPLAAVALVVGLAAARGKPRVDTARAGYLLHGLWLGVPAVVFSAGLVPHTSYMAMLAPPVAALAGGGLVDLARQWRAGGRAAWALPLAVAGTLAWSVHLALAYRRFAPWLPWTLAVAGALTLASLVAGPLVRRESNRWRARVAAVAVVGSLLVAVVAPATWAGSALRLRYAGSTLNAEAGPPLTDAQQDAAAHLDPLRQALLQFLAGGNSPEQRELLAAVIGATDRLDPVQQRIFDYVSAHRGGARYLFATDAWTLASPYVLAKHAEVLTMGGFSGEAPYPSVADFSRLVTTGQVRFVVLATQPILAAGPTLAGVTREVRSACHPVPPERLGLPPTNPRSLAAIGHGVLYACDGRR